MNIGVVVYSFGGRGLSAATKLQAKLVARGHQVTLDRLETVEPLQMGDTTATLRALPAVDGHDALILACPVRGGMPAPPMRVFLEGCPSLAGRTVAFLVSGVMPFAWDAGQTLDHEAGVREQGRDFNLLGSVWVGPGRDDGPIGSLIASQAILESNPHGDTDTDRMIIRNSGRTLARAPRR